MKRLEQLPGTVSERDAARVILANRFERWRHFASAVEKHSDVEAESVHQLRVFSRRIQSALEVFAPVLPKKHVRKIQKQTRRVRRCAGQIRDIDVLAIELERILETANAQERVAIHSHLKSQPRVRRRLSKRLREKLERLKAKGFWHWIDEHYPVVEEVEKLPAAPTDERRLIDRARQTLSGELETFLQAVGDHDPADFEQLHQIRIAAKRFRYVIEVFVSCFSREQRKVLLDPLKTLQDSLGRINDAHNFAEYFDQEARDAEDERSAEGLIALRDRYRRTEEEAAWQFTQTWSTDMLTKYADQFNAVLDELSSSPAADDSAPSSSVSIASQEASTS